ncbi:hypothetical protein FRC07_010199, partial [Ceratobasidium sp. 392]
IKGPKLLQDAWDKQKTVKQNYEALGLVHTLNPVAQGGADNLASTAKSRPAVPPTSEPTSSKSIPRGFGKIVRDESGAVLRIELPEEAEDKKSSPDKGKGKKVGTWGDAMDDSDEETEKMIPAEASNWLRIGGSAAKQEANPSGLGISPKKGGKELVNALEKFSASGTKTPRHASAHELMAELKDLHDATTGFKALLNDDVEGAKKALSEGNSPFHLLGLGVVNFLQAALGMEEGLMPDAIASLTAAEAGAKAAAKATRSAKGNAPSRYPVGMEHEICQADAIVLLGLTQALSESYMGYLQCIAHGKFGKMYKQVFPHGLGSYGTPLQTPLMSRQSSAVNLTTNSTSISSNGSALPTPSSGTSSAASSIVNGKTGNAPVVPIPTVKAMGGLFGRLTGRGNSSQTTLSVPTTPIDKNIVPDGPIEELIVAGAAFGFGLFNLVFSLLPNKVKRVVGLLGYQSDRRLGLEALNVAAGVENDQNIDRHFHINLSFLATYHRLVLMTYNGVVLLLTGWQADEERVVRQYQEILASVECKYPYGSLWLLNRAKLERMTFNPSKAIEILKGGLSAERPVKFRQADALLLFELSWTLLADRRYEEAAESFLKIKELNSWSHATYTFIAAGCYLSLAREKPEFKTKARALLDLVPQLLDRKKIGGRDLPTEVFIQKKIWNTHCRITTTIAQAHIPNLVVLSPVISTASGSFTEEKASPTAELDTGDEIAVRHLLLGVLHRAAGEYALARAHLDAVVADEANVEGKWSGQISKFELAVNDLREVPAGASRDKWASALKAATAHLDQAAARGGANVDLSSRLDSRIALLRDEIELKMQALGLK